MTSLQPTLNCAISRVMYSLKEGGGNINLKVRQRRCGLVYFHELLCVTTPGDHLDGRVGGEGIYVLLLCPQGNGSARFKG